MLDDTMVTAKTVNSFKTKLEMERKTKMGLFLDWNPLDLEAVTDIRSGHPASILQIRWTRKALHFTLSVFEAPWGPSGPQFTNLGVDVEQGLDYQCTKFRPLLITCLQDVCCRTTSTLISMKAWPTDRQKTSASVKDWCMPPHGITGPPDQSSLNSGNKCRLAKPLTLPNFVELRQKVCEISAVENFCSPEMFIKIA